jgi:transposase
LEATLEGEVLRGDQRARIEPFVPGGRKGKRRPRSNGRLFVDALLWMARSGGRRRDLPSRFGPYQTAKRRHYRRRAAEKGGPRAQALGRSRCGF